MIGEIILVFILAVGLLVILWSLAGLLLMPVFTDRMITLLFVCGEEEQLERRVRGFGWFRDGSQNDGRLLLVDCGLSEEGKHCADALQKQYLWVEGCTWDNLAEYLSQTEDTV